ncbi:MAG: glucose-1-phosphate adenylyltransferase [Candidatus Marinimicrobia bacterium]|nr:glucose-1-phosphate adenylyltransferase [Candidatus Neomarinimicrobiota bacterium]
MNAIAMILGGGEGTRLQPLTRDRAKPAVPIGGKYRLVDIPISNCINSGIRRIHLLTQFNSVSLHQHIQATYRFDQFHRGYVRLLAAQQTTQGDMWYRGTADAVRQTLHHVIQENPTHVIILSGDQLYRMDLQQIIAEHVDRQAELTIATKPVARTETRGLGIMRVDKSQRIVDFVEKPTADDELDSLAVQHGGAERYLASMGIYVFNAQTLKDLLDNDLTDFGRDIVPMGIKQRRVYSHVFDGYWRDIGTVRSFWEANLELTDELPSFSFYEANAPIYTHMRYLPPSKINRCDITRSLLSEGCIISGHRVLHAIIGIRAIVQQGAVIEHSVVMGADYYEPEPPPGLPPIGIGPEAFVQHAIIDKNARIGAGAYITPDNKPNNTVTDLYTIRDGVIVIPKNAVIPPGTHL